MDTRKNGAKLKIMMFSQWSEERLGALQITKSRRHGNHRVSPGHDSSALAHRNPPVPTPGTCRSG
ncbi:MAG: hypothetical protein RLO05_00895, partial [Rhodospirillales bacterium]